MCFGNWTEVEILDPPLQIRCCDSKIYEFKRLVQMDSCCGNDEKAQFIYILNWENSISYSWVNIILFSDHVPIQQKQCSRIFSCWAKHAVVACKYFCTKFSIVSNLVLSPFLWNPMSSSFVCSKNCINRKSITGPGTQGAMPQSLLKYVKKRKAAKVGRVNFIYVSTPLRVS